MTASEDRARSTYRFALAFFEQLAHSGVRHVCVSPGSRSTPLAVSAAAVSQKLGSDRFDVSVHLDERSAGFFALGVAKASGAPAALVCTSGTAAANYLPAVVEANHAGVPLVVLTADRPPELRDRGAGQTIDQVNLYGTNVRWFHELAVPEAEGGSPRLARSIAARAAATAAGRPRGPVHLNWPLREPLAPASAPLVDDAALASDAPLVDVAASVAAAPSEAELDAVEELVRSHERGIVACGPLDPCSAGDARALEDALAAFANAAGWPVFAEPGSNLRGGDAPCIAHADPLLKHDAFAAAQHPDVVLRIGRSPTSKPQRLWLERGSPALVLVDPDRAWNDASALATRVIGCEPEALLRALGERLAARPLERRGAFREAFARADAAAARAIDAVVAKEPDVLSPLVVRELAAALRDRPDVVLYASNSMAVRDLDAFWPAEPAPRRVFCNRGTSGIDGVTSSALGAAFASGERVCLLTGDLALLHDIGGLLAARELELRATIVVVNDDGGGIFSYLPIAAHGDGVDFERLFRTPSGVDLAHTAALAGAAFARVDSAQGAGELRSALREALAVDSLSIVEVRVDRDANIAQHRRIDAAVGRELAEAGLG